MPLKAVIFDFDGVIADSEPLHFKAILEVAKRTFGIDFSFAYYLEHLIHFDDRDAFRFLQKSKHEGQELEGSRLDELCNEKQRALERLLEQGEAPAALDGAAELIRALHARGLALAIGTGATRRDIELMLQALGLQPHFPIVVAADDVSKSKPDPETYTKAFQRLQDGCPGLEQRDCIVIEDTAGGAQSALDAGLRVLAVATTGPATKLTHATRVEPNLAEVTPDKLLEWFP
eukprot:EG_transcript_27173